MNDTAPIDEPSGGEADQLGPPLIALFRGVLYADAQPRNWQQLIRLQARVRDHVGVLGLELMLDESEGYAYLRQRPRDDEGDADAPPRLVARRQLSYPVSLLLALLRRKLAEHDASGADSRLVLDQEEIVDMIRMFLPETGDEARLLQRIETHINKAIELGFLRRLRGEQDRYEVRRILKTFVDAQWLREFDERLAEYHAYAAGDEGEGGRAGE
ncbi:MAG: DUF4194 domain-containing protein [Anaerolineales bacterium]|nr:DUF4194 domain-containing protein [Anaerolineales bacterium]